MGFSVRNQEHMNHVMHDAPRELMPFQQFEKMSKQNRTLFEGAIQQKLNQLKDKDGK